MQTGKISVQTENIFPIIKKFLYSDHDIFLRELVSNAVDASSKLKTLALKGEATGELGDIFVEIKVNKDAKTIQIIDRGIGMTQDEVEKYINQVAFSSAQEFVDKYQNEAQVIGHFGLGFYSAFMVAHTVTIETLSYKSGSQAVKWTCDGSTDYTLETIEKADRGTIITLQIAEDSEEFLQDSRISDLLNKYCKFLPIDIIFGTSTETIEIEPKTDDKEAVTETITSPKRINNPNPLWKRSPNEISDAEYIAFYQELYPFSPEPLFWTHINVDHPFNLTGILYFPKVDTNFELQKNKIQLYSNQVFVTNQVDNIVPEWLTLLHGVIDSPDIPLNVSRSYLQADGNVKKINAHISKKVSDKLEELFKQDRKAYEEKWENIGLFVKYGMLSDEKFFERAKKALILIDLDGNSFTIDELEAATKDTQTNKDNKLVQLYTTDVDGQYTYIQSAKSSNYKILKMSSVIDNHFVAHLEHKLENWSFARVDSDTVDKLIEKDEVTMSSVLSEDKKTELSKAFGDIIATNNITVELRDLAPDDLPVRLTQNEFFRRMGDMQRVNGGNNALDFYTMVVNSNHPLVIQLSETTDLESKTKICNHLYDLGLLGQNKLKGERLANFMQRAISFMH